MSDIIIISLICIFFLLLFFNCSKEEYCFKCSKCQGNNFRVDKRYDLAYDEFVPTNFGGKSSDLHIGVGI